MSTYQIIIVALCFILNFNDSIDVLVVSFTGSEIDNDWGLRVVTGLAGFMAFSIPSKNVN